MLGTRCRTDGEKESNTINNRRRSKAKVWLIGYTDQYWRMNAARSEKPDDEDGQGTQGTAWELAWFDG